MLRKAASSLLAVLILGTMLVGQCASCPLIPAPPQSRGCCGHQGDNCQMPAKSGGRTCPAQALAPASYPQLQFGAAQFVPALAAIAVAAAPPPRSEAAAGEAAPCVHAPPDLYLLNSILLV